MSFEDWELIFTDVDMINIAPEERDICSKGQAKALIAPEERNVFLLGYIIIVKHVANEMNSFNV